MLSDDIAALTVCNTSGVISITATLCFPLSSKRLKASHIQTFHSKPVTYRLCIQQQQQQPFPYIIIITLFPSVCIKCASPLRTSPTIPIALRALHPRAREQSTHNHGLAFIPNLQQRLFPHSQSSTFASQCHELISFRRLARHGSPVHLSHLQLRFISRLRVRRFSDSTPAASFQKAGHPIHISLCTSCSP